MADEARGLNRAVPIEWDVPDDIPSFYATNIVIQHTEREFILYLFQFWPPLLMGTDEEKQAQAEKIEAVRAKAIARVVLAPDTMFRAVAVMQENLNKFIQRMEAEEQHIEGIELEKEGEE